MNRSRVLLALIILLASCKEESKTLPKSTGLFSEIIFVVSDDLWNQSIEMLATQIFCTPIKGINQLEPEFNVLQINHTEFKSVFRTHKNIVIISTDLAENSQKNKWAKHQLVFQLNLNKRAEELIEELEKIKNIFNINERLETRKSISKKSNKSLEQNIKNNFNIEIVIPNEYVAIEDKKSIFWATYNPKNREEIKQLIIYSFQASSDSLKQEVIQKTDSVFAKYFLGPTENSYVKMEPMYPPLYEKGFYRGLWRLENGFMGGSFLIKTYSFGMEVVVVAGVIFAPQSKKRRHIKALEAIL